MDLPWHWEKYAINTHKHRIMQQDHKYPKQAASIYFSSIDLLERFLKLFLNGY
jgi:hypothetical protein